MAAATKKEIVRVSDQPRVAAWLKPKVREKRPVVAVITPGMSYLLFPSALDSFTNLRARMKAISAIGTLTPKHQRQEKNSVSDPPRIKPIAAPPPEIAPITPNAFARSLGTVKITEIIASAAGARSAAKTP